MAPMVQTLLATEHELTEPERDLRRTTLVCGHPARDGSQDATGGSQDATDGKPTVRPDTYAVGLNAADTTPGSDVPLGR
jgi:hypothetical protein